MKKFLLSILALAWIFFLWSSVVSASGCFHDALNKDAHYETITSWVRVRTVACMYGSDVITTLGWGTIVKVIAYNWYWKQIEMTDGRAGWIGSNFATRTNQTANIPCSGIIPGDYCHTIDRALCPNPSAQWVEPTRYTRATPAVYQCSSYVTPEPTPEPVVYTPPTPPVIAVSDSMKPKLDMMTNSVATKINNKYGTNLDGKLSYYKTLVAALTSIKKSAPNLANLIDYLVTNFEEKIALIKLESVLNID